LYTENLILHLRYNAEHKIQNSELKIPNSQSD
jgi:hypothetical protein